jgi:cytochrome c biogenesis protein CcmG/thiol:disulfide interchange protein DsbE
MTLRRARIHFLLASLALAATFAAAIAFADDPKPKPSPRGGSDAGVSEGRHGEGAVDARDSAAVAARSTPPPTIIWTPARIRGAALAVRDRRRADSTSAAILDYLRGKADSSHVELLRYYDLDARLHVAGDASVVHDGLVRLLGEVRRDTFATIGYLLETMRHFAERPVGQKLQTQYVARVMNLTQNRPDLAAFRAAASGYRGLLDMEVGPQEAAVGHMEGAITTTFDRPRMLRWLGLSYQRAGRSADAIESYAGALAAYPAKDTAALAPLRKLWIEKNGSIAGLAERIAPEREKARAFALLESRRLDRDAAFADLRALDGRTFDAGALAGKVAVVMLWSTESGPSRRALSSLEALRQSEAARDAAVLAIAVPRPIGTPEARIARSAELIAAEKYAFANAVDPPGRIARDLGAGYLPTTFVLDAAGKVRYRNVGEENLADAVRAQIEALSAAK